ncbi:hypothetical protein ACFL5V_00085 [Fibrobacterota bacterium]
MVDFHQVFFKKSSFFLRILLLFLFVIIGILPAQPEKRADSTESAFPPPDTSKPTFRDWPSRSWEKGWFACQEPAETAADCFRGLNGVSIAHSGFPGTRSSIYSMSALGSVAYHSVFNPVAGFSPYGSGGLLAPATYKADMNGGNVYAVREVWNIPARIDTPRTRFSWERGAFAMNVFRLDFSRMLTKNLYAGFGFASDRSDSLDYGYTFQVHQPYLSGIAGLDEFLPFLERDSASLVIKGVSQAVNSLHFRPRLGIRLGRGSVLELYLDRFKNESDLSSPLADTIQFFYTEKIMVPVPSEFYSLSLGGIFHLQYRELVSTVKYFRAILEKKEYVSNPLEYYRTHSDSGFSNRQIDETLDEVELEASLPGIYGNPQLRVRVRNEIVRGKLYTGTVRGDSSDTAAVPPDKDKWGDEQDWEASLTPEWRFLGADLRAGLKRHSLMHKEVDYLADYSLRGKAELPLGFALMIWHGYLNRQPGWEQRYCSNSMFFHYPNPDLEHETILNYGSGVRARFWNVQLSALFNVNTITNSIMPALLPFRELPDTLDFTALRLINYEEEQRNTIGIRASIALGNWDVALENSYLVDNTISGPQIDGQRDSYNPGLPGNFSQGLAGSIYKGHLGWGNRFVYDRLGVRVAWDWEWYPVRFAWAPQLNGYSKVVKLDEYLALDFIAQMQVKQFILYFQIKNFYHDRYYHEPGNHPPGVNFRWGVHWQLDG